MSASKRIDWLDMLRGFAIVCVIFGHPTKVPSDIELWIYSFHMPLFFMISGATFRGGKYDSLGSCLADQAKKLLVPYVCLYLVSIPFWYINRCLFGSSKYTVMDQLPGILYGDANISPMPNGALWFLPALFLTSVVFWFLYDLDRRGKISLSASIIWCFLLGICIAKFTHVSWVWHVQCVPILLVFYYLGHHFMDAISRLKDKGFFSSDVYLNWVVFAAIACIAIGTWAAFANGKISVYGNQYKTMALALLSCLGISAGLLMLFMNCPIIKPLDYIGRNSLAFFGFHVPVMRFLENVPIPHVSLISHPLWIAAFTLLLLFPITHAVTRWVPILIGRLPRRRM